MTRVEERPCLKEGDLSTEALIEVGIGRGYDAETIGWWLYGIQQEVEERRAKERAKQGVQDV